RSCPAHPQRKRSRVPKRRRFRHSVPRLSSISDAWGRLNVVTPFHHLSGDSHLHRSLGAGPITASSPGDRPQVLSFHGSIILSLPLGPGRNEFGPAVVRVRTAKSAVAGDHFLHAHFVGWQTAIVRKEIALTSARAPRHLSGLA